jgi:hypothetical protein
MRKNCKTSLGGGEVATRVADPDPKSIRNSSSCRTRTLIQDTDPEVLKMPSILQKSTRNTSKIIFFTFYDFFLRSPVGTSSLSLKTLRNTKIKND